MRVLPYEEDRAPRMFLAQEAILNALQIEETLPVYRVLEYTYERTIGVKPTTVLSVIRELEKAHFVSLSEDGWTLSIISDSEYAETLVKYIRTHRPDLLTEETQKENRGGEFRAELSF